MRLHRTGNAKPFGCALRIATMAFIGALAWLIGPHAALAERVGVVVTTTVNISADEALRLADTLGQALRSELEVDVIAGDEAARRLPPEGLPDICVADPACQRDVGRRLSADELLLVSMVRVGAQTQIDVTWVEVATGRTVSREGMRLKDDGPSARTVFEQAASVLLPAATPRRAVVDGTAPGDNATARPMPPETAQPRPRRMTTSAWLAGGIALGAGIAGSAVAVSAWRDYGDLEDRGCERRPCPQSDIDSVDRQALVADLLLVTAVAAAATAGILYWRSGRDSSSRDDAATRAPGGIQFDFAAIAPIGPVGAGAGVGIGPGVAIGGRF